MSGGATSDWRTVQVREHVYFTQQPPAEDEVSTKEDYSACVLVEGGFPPYEYQWLKELTGSQMPLDAQETMCLILENIDFEDAGDYSVEVRDSFEDITQSSNLRLTVHQGVPLAGVMGLGGLAAAIAGAGLVLLRRKR